LAAEGDFGISQNGIVFDSSQGLEASIPGVTVTLMVSQSEWGGWVPWPAHMYGGQQNPQVTGADGSFAFLAPADTYHLQVEALPGYQAWRSPVFTDAAQINAPYTPWTDEADQVVVMGSDGLEPATVIVPAGGAVEWIASMSESTTPDTLMSLIDNPIMQPRTWDVLDPLTSTLGFDGGMLAPGQVYRRMFTEPGIYPYTDGAGHEGQVEVTGAFGIYLPLVLRK
ncbi:MAG: hypothetical protein JXA42_19470, partial [Anaerolineales bacterium]|nr:hypothetical protein [Anaerolineales bacterium]